MASEDRVVGATIAGKYRVRRIIGAGSMGVVCEAEHVDIGKRVAIKLIDASLAGMKDITLRFRQEARAASLVESQHIVQVFDVGTDDALGLYLVMEFLVGEDLARALAREGRLPIARATRVALGVARGLAKAHEAGVVHRDLKPANIFLCARDDDEPLAKILDFGISKLVDSSRAKVSPGLKLTRDGMVVGTPQYMSPEQAQGFAVDARTDVWSLGLVLYEMLAGRPAYPELPSYERFIIQLVSEPPQPIRGVAPWVPAELAALVHAALEHDLAKRVRSAADLVRALVEIDVLAGAAPSPRSARSGSGRAVVADASDTLVMRDRPEPTPAPAALAAGATRRELAILPEETRDASIGPDESGAVPSARGVPSGLASSGVRGAARVTPGPAEDFEQDAPQFFDRKMLESLGGSGGGALSAPASSGPATPPASRGEEGAGARATPPAGDGHSMAVSPVRGPPALGRVERDGVDRADRVAPVSLSGRAAASGGKTPWVWAAVLLVVVLLAVAALFRR